MKMNKGSQILLGLVISCSTLLLAAAPEWIQYNERVVGENSPYYTDVVNRPMKQIWGNFTSQHTTGGEHKAFIFPTPIPTAAFPTPFPTATPKPDATPQPTCTPIPAFPTPLPTATPGPEFPTPLPTATPIPSLILSLAQYGSTQTVGSLPYTIDAANSGCSGIMHKVTGQGTLTLPSNTDSATYGCHTVRIYIIQSAGTTTISSGSGTGIVFPGGTAYTSISNTTPVGAYIEFLYDAASYKWIVSQASGTWTAS